MPIPISPGEKRILLKRGSRESFISKTKEGVRTIQKSEPILIYEEDGSVTFAIGTDDNKILEIANGVGVDFSIQTDRAKLNKNLSFLLVISKK